MELKELEKYDEQSTIVLKGERWKFVYWGDSAGWYGGWQSKTWLASTPLNNNDEIYMTGYRGIPCELTTNDGELLGHSEFLGEVKNFFEYKKICRMLIENIFYNMVK